RKPPVVLQLLNSDIAIVSVRRHYTTGDYVTDERRVHTHLIVVQKLHRTDAARPMADDAVFVDDRGDVRGVRNLRSGHVANELNRPLLCGTFGREEQRKGDYRGNPGRPKRLAMETPVLCHGRFLRVESGKGSYTMLYYLK